MIKIFVQRDHHELEAQINNWICSNSIEIVNMFHSVCTLDDEIIHSIVINYKSEDSRPC